LAICYGYFTIHREKEEAKNFVHRISSTANVEPEVFGNRTFEKFPVQGFDKVGGLRIWEIRFDISNEPLHQPIQVRYVIFFWNNFNTKAQWDAGTRIYNSRTDPIIAGEDVMKAARIVATAMIRVTGASGFSVARSR
jgi:hypothetical protein